jgi:hypothetical protein
VARPGTSVAGVIADASTPEGAAPLFERVPKADILVDNLGIYEAKPFAEIPDEDWLNLFNVNVMNGQRPGNARLALAAGASVTIVGGSGSQRRRWVASRGESWKVQCTSTRSCSWWTMPTG